MAEQSDEDLFIASLTVAEIRRGVIEKPAGRWRDQLDTWFTGRQGLQALSAGRILRSARKRVSSRPSVWLTEIRTAVRAAVLTRSLR